MAAVLEQSAADYAAAAARGRPVFPGVGHGMAVEEPFKQHGLVLKDTRTLDPATDTVVQEWGPPA